MINDFVKKPTDDKKLRLQSIKLKMKDDIRPYYLFQRVEKGGYTNIDTKQYEEYFEGFCKEVKNTNPKMSHDQVLLKAYSKQVKLYSSSVLALHVYNPVSKRYFPTRPRGEELLRLTSSSDNPSDVHDEKNLTSSVTFQYGSQFENFHNIPGRQETPQSSQSSTESHTYSIPLHGDPTEQLQIHTIIPNSAIEASSQSNMQLLNLKMNEMSQEIIKLRYENKELKESMNNEYKELKELILNSKKETIHDITKCFVDTNALKGIKGAIKSLGDELKSFKNKLSAKTGEFPTISITDKQEIQNRLPFQNDTEMEDFFKNEQLVQALENYISATVVFDEDFPKHCLCLLLSEEYMSNRTFNINRRKTK